MSVHPVMRQNFAGKTPPFSTTSETLSYREELSNSFDLFLIWQWVECDCAISRSVESVINEERIIAVG